jgi:hypothetical protein
VPAQYKVTTDGGTFLVTTDEPSQVPGTEKLGGAPPPAATPNPGDFMHQVDTTTGEPTFSVDALKHSEQFAQQHPVQQFLRSQEIPLAPEAINLPGSGASLMGRAAGAIKGALGTPEGREAAIDILPKGKEINKWLKIGGKHVPSGQPQTFNAPIPDIERPNIFPGNLPGGRMLGEPTPTPRPGPAWMNNPNPAPADLAPPEAAPISSSLPSGRIPGSIAAQNAPPPAVPLDLQSPVGTSQVPVKPAGAIPFSNPSTAAEKLANAFTAQGIRAEDVGSLEKANIQAIAKDAGIGNVNTQEIGKATAILKQHQSVSQSMFQRLKDKGALGIAGDLYNALQPEPLEPPK